MQLTPWTTRKEVSNMMSFVVGLVMGGGVGLVLAMAHHAMHMSDAHPDRYTHHDA